MERCGIRFNWKQERLSMNSWQLVWANRLHMWFSMLVDIQPERLLTTLKTKEGPFDSFVVTGSIVCCHQGQNPPYPHTPIPRQWGWDMGCIINWGPTKSKVTKLSIFRNLSNIACLLVIMWYCYTHYELCHSRVSMVVADGLYLAPTTRPFSTGVPQCNPSIWYL